LGKVRAGNLCAREGLRFGPSVAISAAWPVRDGDVLAEIVGGTCRRGKRFRAAESTAPAAEDSVEKRSKGRRGNTG